MLLAGCIHSDVSVYSEIDPTQKTITVPPGNALLVGAIKQRLQKSAWKLVVYRGPTRTVGTVGERTDLATGDTFKTRYRLMINQRQFDMCITGDPALFYDLSLIDNETGEEVFAQSGRDCRDRAVDKFMDAINGKAG
jgi:hypothetical protein